MLSFGWAATDIGLGAARTNEEISLATWEWLHLPHFISVLLRRTGVSHAVQRLRQARQDSSLVWHGTRLWNLQRFAAWTVRAAEARCIRRSHGIKRKTDHEDGRNEKMLTHRSYPSSSHSEWSYQGHS